tara:strand:+ start:7220 stop:7750 length:531 start_codon:yes stop_codon:yes gene_type:complete
MGFGNFQAGHRRRPSIAEIVCAAQYAGKRRNSACSRQGDQTEQEYGMKKISQTSVFRLTAAVMAGSLLLVLQGCSSIPRPEGEMASANTALISAENQDAALHAPVAMDRAKDKLRRAKQAMQDEDYAEARRLADEALADAEYAQAFTSKTRVEQALSDMQTSIEVLQNEISRGQGN